MKMNRRKTKIMCNAVAKRRKRIDGEQLEKVEEYKYLGRLITPGKKYRRELHQLGRDLDSTERSLEIRECPCPMCLKKKIMNTVILPAMLYGAETWSLVYHQI